MAIIYTYPVKTTPANDDLILISDSADGNKTKQIKVSSMPGAQGSGITSLNGATGASQTFAIGNNSPVTIVTDGSNNTHTFGWSGQLAVDKGGTGLGSLGRRGQVLRVNSAVNALQYDDSMVVKAMFNNSGSELLAGTPVEVVGTQTVDGIEYLTVSPAGANAGSTMPACGLVKANASNETIVDVILNGILKSVRTNNIPGVSGVGAVVYVSASVGTAIPWLTGTKPTGTNLVQSVGVVTKYAGAGAGSIQVIGAGRSSDLPNFTAQGDIWVGNANNVPTPLTIGSNGTVLTSNGTTATWGAAAATGVTTIDFSTTGLTPNSATSGAVTVGGTLSGANGGTGYSTYSAGDILYATTGVAPAGSLTKLTIGSAGQVLTVNGAGQPSWAAATATSSGISGRVQLSDGSGAFTSNNGLAFASQSLTIGDPAAGQGKLTIKGNQSGSPSQLILHSSYNSASPPVSQGSYTIQPPGTTLGPTAFTWTLPNGAPSATGSVLTTATTGNSATLAWAPKVPVANGGTNQTTIGAYAVVVGTGATTTELSSASTSVIQMPAGTTAQRPTGVAGMLRYNTSINKLEVFTATSGGQWETITSAP